MICKFADFIIEFKNVPKSLKKHFTDFLCDGIPQAVFEITDSDIEFEKSVSNEKYGYNSYVFAAYLRKVANWIINHYAFLLHSALIEYNGEGVAFAAKSGTGKTTHIKLWQKLLGDRVTVINGDKPIVRFFENSKYPLGYGTAWNGKEHFGNCECVPIKHICFIERNEKNSCKKVNAQEVLPLIFKQVYMPDDAIGKSKTLKMINRFLNEVNIWKVKCNMDIEACEVVFNTIFKEKSDEA